MSAINGIDKADDNVRGEEDKMKRRPRFILGQKKRGHSEQSFYSMYGAGDRAASSSPEQAAQCRVAVLRTIPGDDSGLAEELWLTKDQQFIREQEAGSSAMQRTVFKWFIYWCSNNTVTWDKVRQLGQ